MEDRSKHPLAVIRAMKQSGVKEVIVAFSSGKDSLACLELCVEHFDRVVPYFMYIVKGLSFQEQHLKYIEAKYSLEVLRIPDWRLAKMLAGDFCRHKTVNSQSTKIITWRDVDNYVRSKTGIHWVASGETVNESLHRRGMIVSSNGICPKRGHFYPVGWWRRQDVHSFLSQRGIILPSEYRIMRDGRSFGGISPTQLADIKASYPDDYAKILKLFPLAEIQIVRGAIMDEERAKADALKKSEREERNKIKVADRSRLRKEARLASRKQLESQIDKAIAHVG